MRVPLAWLREFVDVDLAPEALADRLTLLGMEVKGIETWGADWRNVVVGELLTVERHPRADRLSLTTVTTGSGAPLGIVCGATNIAPGQRVPVALPGAVLPGNRRIERTEKMGVVSNGMLCSGDELGMTSDADGILILPSDTPLGRPLTELFGDTVLDVDVKPNRGDALSILGLAREVAAVTGGPLRMPTTDFEESGGPVTERLQVEVLDPDLCPRFVGRWVSGVRVGPSPDRVQMRLMAAGQRPISNVVDASNYVMIELGKPIHVFDGAAVHDGRIIVRRAKSGERIETLDHVERTLDPETLVIADPRGPIGIAGVMGGADSEVGERTTEVAVESAIFDPVSIRRTAFRYALRSDASLRFEKGQEFRLARVGADRTAQLVADWAGGTIALGAVDSNPVDPPRSRVTYRPARVNRLLGTALAPHEQAALLARVGIDAEPAPIGTPITVAAGSTPLELDGSTAETWFATVPTWRRDLVVEADVTEEIIRVRGYETVPPILPHTPMPEYRHSPLEVRDMLRETLAGAGVSEVVTHALVAPHAVEQFPPALDDRLPGEPGQRAGGWPVRVTNPLSSQHSVLRQSLLGSLLDVISTNLRHDRDDVAIFEVGKGYGTGDGPAAPTHEWWRLGIALTGSAEPPAWNRAARPYDLDDGKGLVELLCHRLGLPAPAYEPLTDDPVFHPGRSTRVTAGDGLSGRLGELHPRTAAALDLRVDRVILAELAVAGLAAGRLTDARGATPSRFPAVQRDLAVVVDVARPAAAVAASVRAHAGALLRAVELFDIYRGRPLSDTEKSLAWRLTFGSDERTLTESEVDEAMAAVAAGLAQDVGGRLRS
ncbi:MAG TPA: phenylalanine--tRNA ligase subunit beta [Candidatus Limnocylindrales bacterium]